MMNMNTVQNSTPPGLVRGLGLWSAIAVVVGSMIGQAVFLVGSDMAQELGSVTKLLAAWTIGGVLHRIAQDAHSHIAGCSIHAN
jgi:APA family basic amino acid/polyamine antiporter